MPRPASSLSSRPISSTTNHHDLNNDKDLTAEDNPNDVPATAMTGPTTAAAVNPLLRENPHLSPLEQEVLDEYARLLGHMNKLSDSLAYLSTRPAAETLDALRLLERKTATVCTLLKASVYSIVLQQQIYNGEDGGDRGESHGPEHGQEHNHGQEEAYGRYGEGD
ncbi:hypothetical protein AJ78_03463 [Emergomyces pasteurianus Ep9510]|uniref:DASH complex subunit DAD3 n=1 Tax=Emergomyces pasteurianus Ep9510 TaxID=1447872 RepID=A0A1J9QKE7_9EURO|nr:hypothetical protein AJ78_03463 [Emergomyces pasteurianus Ep9510]